MASNAAQAAKTAYRTFRELHGVVISAGLMDKTVKVRVGGQKWNSFLKKYFDDPQTHIVHDPANSLRLGDVVAITPGWRVSKSKRHVVKHIIAPGSGVPIEGRAPIPTEEARHAERAVQRAAKDERRAIKKMTERVEKQMVIAERLMKSAGKQLALRARLAEGSGAGAGAGAVQAQQ